MEDSAGSELMFSSGGRRLTVVDYRTASLEREESAPAGAARDARRRRLLEEESTRRSSRRRNRNPSTQVGDPSVEKTGGNSGWAADLFPRYYTSRPANSVGIRLALRIDHETSK